MSAALFADGFREEPWWWEWAPMQAFRTEAAPFDDDVVIVGSGLSYHNLRLFGPAGSEPSRAFDSWLDGALRGGDPKRRIELLKQWEEAPAARICHPREDHLIPLMTAVGAAESEAATRIYHDTDAYGGITASSYRFG